jgi:hypothetical protein
MGQKSLFNRVPSPAKTVIKEGLTETIQKSRKKIITPVKERDIINITISTPEDVVINNELIPDNTEEE